MSPEPSTREPAPDCFRCRAYYVTYDASLPHGCRSFGFQSVRLPRDEVRLSSGAECAAYEPKRLPSRPEQTPET